MTTATDGWELAKTSVRDLMAEADLHAEEAGGDFAGEADRLGAAMAQVHADLARAFGTGELSAGELRTRAPRPCTTRLDRALGVVPELAEVEDGLRAAFDDFAAVADAGADPARPRRPAPGPGAAHRAPLGRARLRGRADELHRRSGGRSTPRCATSPACCARFDYAARYPMLEQAAHRPAAGVPRQRMGRPQPRRLLRRLRRDRRPRPARGRARCFAASRPTRRCTRRCMKPATGPLADRPAGAR